MDADHRARGAVTAGDLAALLATLDAGLGVDATHVSLRFVAPDGRLRHVNVHADGAVTVQAAAANPRLVPYGPYCYGAVSMEAGADGRPVMSTSGCPFHHDLGGQNAFCSLMDHDDWSCMWDQVKVCGLNGNDDHDFPGNPDRMWRDHLGAGAPAAGEDDDADRG